MSNYGAVSTIGSAKQASTRRHYADVGNKLMKRTFKQRFKDWLFAEPPDEVNYISVDEESVQLDRGSSIKFTIHHANGGRVVQTRRYDEIKDRNIENLYVITNDKEFGYEIDKIIVMEGLR
jgi:hypothetical protein